MDQPARRSRYRVVALLLLAGVAGACGGTLRPDLDVKVAAENGMGPEKVTTFSIAVADSNRVLASRVEEVIRKELETRGMKSVTDGADLVLQVDYTVGPQKTVREIAITPLFRTVRVPGTTQTRQVGQTKDGKPIMETFSTPGTSTDQYIGDQLVCEESRLQEKRLRVRARRTGATAESDGWNVTARATDAGADITRYAPLLALAAAKQMAQNTGAEVALTVSSSGKKVVPTKRPKIERDTLMFEGQHKRPGDPC